MLEDQRAVTYLDQAIARIICHSASKQREVAGANVDRAAGIAATAAACDRQIGYLYDWRADKIEDPIEAAGVNGRVASAGAADRHALFDIQVASQCVVLTDAGDGQS